MFLHIESDMHNKTQLLTYWQKHFQFRPNELRAFYEVDRANFVLEEHKQRAYEDRPLPLLREKTISQPTTVMMMTSALEIQPGETIFEVGTGSGYQAAILARMVRENGRVITTEVIPELVHFAKDNLFRSNISNVTIYETDGSNGIDEHAPYDKIIITAACKKFPQELLNQLKPEGLIIGPVGEQNQQEMVRGTKTKDGKLQLDFLGQYLFTPMYGKYGFIN